MQLDLFWDHFDYPNTKALFYYWYELPLTLYAELEEMEKL